MIKIQFEYFHFKYKKLTKNCFFYLYFYLIQEQESANLHQVLLSDFSDCTNSQWVAVLPKLFLFQMFYVR